jgi:hypothetical protein
MVVMQDLLEISAALVVLGLYPDTLGKSPVFRNNDPIADHPT